ncbi:MAG: proline iminopeptidase-family hydrolase [Tepidisphaeraceae bacterium]
MAIASHEGTIEVEDGYRIWYRRVGTGDRTPLLCLHGGPGAGHDYLETLAGLADERPVVFYDQLGCGRSDKPNDPGRWRIGRFVNEVNLVRRALGLDRIHLLGQSWGGWLGIEYMLTRPPGVVSVTLASTSASLPQFVAETERLKSELPADVYDTLKRYEAAGDYRNPAYEAAAEVFYRQHVCRTWPWPEPFQRTVANLTNNQVYETMNGPNEFIVIGNLKDWDRTARLGEITEPTLVTVGRFDEITPACSETIHRGIAGSKLVVFEQRRTLCAPGRDRALPRRRPPVHPGSRGPLSLAIRPRVAAVHVEAIRLKTFTKMSRP